MDLDASGTTGEVETAFSSPPAEALRALLDGKRPFVPAFPDDATGVATSERIEADLTASNSQGRGSFDLVDAERTISFDPDDMARSMGDYDPKVEPPLAARAPRTPSAVIGTGS